MSTPSPSLPLTGPSLPDPFEELCDALREGDLIICVGPMLSTMAGFPSFDEVALALLESALEQKAHVDESGLRDLVAAGNAARALDLLSRALGSVQFIRRISELLDDPARRIPALAHGIAALRQQLRAVYTTNLDRLIERALEGTWPSFPRPQTALTQRQKIVFKLRGDLQAHGSWVVTDSQEETEFASPISRRRRLFDRAYNSHCMLFVAFEARCPTLAKLLRMPTPPEPGEPKASHYIVLDDTATGLERDELTSRGLSILPGTAEQLINRLSKRLSLRPHSFFDPSHDHADAIDPGDTNPIPKLRSDCPYPGLQPFSYDLRDVFFGRYTEVSEATGLLGWVDEDQHPHHWLAIEGPSGVGKSSFVFAGLLPALRRGFAPGTPNRWWVASMRPGRYPLQTLATVILTMLAEHEPDRGDASPERIVAFAAEMRAFPPALVRELARHRVGNTGLLLIVDQLEESISLSTPEERGPFSAAIAAAIDNEVIYLITTTRSDLVPQLPIGAPALGEVYNDRARRYVLPPVSLAGLREAITRPALRVGVTIEPALVERILNDADGRTESERRDSSLSTGASTLALAAHLLRVLWDSGAADDDNVTLEEYEQAGGLEGALGKSADELLGNLNEVVCTGAKDLLLALVTPSWRGHPVRRTLPRSHAVEIAGGGSVGEHIVNTLSGGGEGRSSLRLLTIYQDGAQTYVDLVHEALITGWKTYGDWISAAWPAILREDKVRRWALEWRANGYPPIGLSADIPVEGLLQVKPKGPYSELVKNFQVALGAANQRLQEREQRTIRLRKLRLGLLSAVTGLIIGALGGRLTTTAPAVVSNRDHCPKVEDDQSRELGLRASRLASIPGAELEALELAVQAVGRVQPSAEPPPVEAIDGLVDALTNVRLCRTLRAHKGALSEAVFSPTASLLATAGADGRVRLWDPDSGDILHECQAHESPIAAAAFSRDGSLLATASSDHTIKIWSTADLQPVGQPLRPRDALPVTAIAFTPNRSDGISIVAGDSGGLLTMWTLGQGGNDEPRLRFEVQVHDRAIAAIAVSPDGEQVASAGTKALVRLIGVDNGEAIEQLEAGAEVVGLAWAPAPTHGSSLAVAEADGSVRVWDLESGEYKGFVAHHAPLTGLAFSADGKVLATSSVDQSARLWDPQTGKLLARFDGHRGAVAAVDVSLDTSMIATAGADGTARLWRIQAEPIKLTAHRATIERLIFSPDGSRLLTFGGDHYADLWDASSGAWIASLRGHERVVAHALFSPDSSIVLTADEHDGARLWTAEGEPLGRLEAAIESPVSGIMFAHDGATLVTFAAGRPEPQRWDVAARAPIRRLKHADGVVALVAAPAGPFMYASVSKDEKVRLWSATVDEPVVAAGLTKVTALVFSADGQWLAAAGQGGIRVWNTPSLAAGDPSPAAMIIDEHDQPVLALALSHDGSRLATAHADGFGDLWDTSTKAVVAWLGLEVRDVAFNRDGTLLASQDRNGIHRIWAAGTGEPVDLFYADAFAFSPIARAELAVARGDTILLLQRGLVQLLADACGIIELNVDEPQARTSEVCSASP